MIPLLSLGIPSADVFVRFDQPAHHFTESCPLGNGRLGAMVFGGIQTETIVLNENTLWSGGVYGQNKADAYKSRDAILRLLFAGKNDEAERLVNQTFVSDGPGSGSGSGKDGPYGCYQVLGKLSIDFGLDESGVIGYQRTLDLQNALCTTKFESYGTRYTREVFVSHPDQAIILRLRADKDSMLNFRLGLSRDENSYLKAVSRDELLMEGRTAKNPQDGVKYVCRIKVRPIGHGKVTCENNKICFSNGQEAIVTICAGTTYSGPVPGLFMGQSYLEATKKQLSQAQNKSWQNLYLRHQKDFRSLFDRVSLRIGEAKSGTTLKRMQSMQKGNPDPSFASLAFQFGRYLLISSSRPGGLPANLQGLWAEELQTPWNGDYHLDINVQMNYWPAEVTNLAECALPVHMLCRSLVAPGNLTAKAYYNAPGWVAHTITNPWGYTAPGESASWGSTNTCGAWLANHLYTHYSFTQDLKTLRANYESLKGAAEFFLAMLVPTPDGQYLVTGPSNSPENAFALPSGKTASTCLGPTIDQQIVRELFQATSVAAKALGRDEDFRRKLEAARLRLVPNKVGPDGRLQEWLEPYKETEPQHRHVSHLYGLYPGYDISRFTSKDLSIAAEKTLNTRGDRSTGWSIAWKVCFWSRLLDGDRCLKLLHDLWTPVGNIGYDYVSGGGTYTNLFCAHPPFQIDGNFGACAGIAEMLLQSHEGGIGGLPVIHFLPALPHEWTEGEVTGLRARGGLVVDIKWKGQELEVATIKRVASSGPVRIRVNQGVKITNRNRAVLPKVITENMIELPIKVGDIVTILPKKT